MLISWPTSGSQIVIWTLSPKATVFKLTKKIFPPYIERKARLRHHLARGVGSKARGLIQERKRVKEPLLALGYISNVDSPNCSKAQNRPSVHTVTSSWEGLPCRWRELKLGQRWSKLRARSEVTQNVTAVVSRDRSEESRDPTSIQHRRWESAVKQNQE